MYDSWTEIAVLFRNFLGFICVSRVSDHIALIQVIITPLCISTDKSDLPLDDDCGVYSEAFIKLVLCIVGNV